MGERGIGGIVDVVRKRRRPAQSSVFSGAVVALTGAASGIGRELAVQLDRCGARLALADIDLPGLAETRDRCTVTGDIEVSGVDVADRDAMAGFAKSAVERFGRVDIVINCAGILHAGTVAATPHEQFETVLRTDFWGVLNGTKAFLPYLLESRSPSRIVNLSSAVGLHGVAGYAAYCTAKAAIKGFTESLQLELAATNVRVSAVYPGGIRTPIARSALHAPDVDRDQMIARFEQVVARTDADEAAHQILAGVARGDTRILVGADARLADIAARVGGRSYDRWISAATRLARIR